MSFVDWLLRVDKVFQPKGPKPPPQPGDEPSPGSPVMPESAQDPSKHYGSGSQPGGSKHLSPVGSGFMQNQPGPMAAPPDPSDGDRPKGAPARRPKDISTAIAMEKPVPTPHFETPNAQPFAVHFGDRDISRRANTPVAEELHTRDAWPDGKRIVSRFLVHRDAANFKDADGNPVDNMTRIKLQLAKYGYTLRATNMRKAAVTAPGYGTVAHERYATSKPFGRAHPHVVDVFTVTRPDGHVEQEAHDHFMAGMEKLGVGEKKVKPAADIAGGVAEPADEKEKYIRAVSDPILTASHHGWLKAADRHKELVGHVEGKSPIRPISITTHNFAGEKVRSVGNSVTGAQKYEDVYGDPVTGVGVKWKASKADVRAARAALAPATAQSAAQPEPEPSADPIAVPQHDSPEDAVPDEVRFRQRPGKYRESLLQAGPRLDERRELQLSSIMRRARLEESGVGGKVLRPETKQRVDAAAWEMMSSVAPMVWGSISNLAKIAPPDRPVDREELEDAIVNALGRAARRYDRQEFPVKWSTYANRTIKGVISSYWKNIAPERPVGVGAPPPVPGATEEMLGGVPAEIRRSVGLVGATWPDLCAFFAAADPPTFGDLYKRWDESVHWLIEQQIPADRPRVFSPAAIWNLFAIAKAVTEAQAAPREESSAKITDMKIRDFAKHRQSNPPPGIVYHDPGDARQAAKLLAAHEQSLDRFRRENPDGSPPIGAMLHGHQIEILGHEHASIPRATEQGKRIGLMQKVRYRFVGNPPPWAEAIGIPLSEKNPEHYLGRLHQMRRPDSARLVDPLPMPRPSPGDPAGAQTAKDEHLLHFIRVLSDPSTDIESDSAQQMIKRNIAEHDLMSPGRAGYVKVALDARRAAREVAEPEQIAPRQQIMRPTGRTGEEGEEIGRPEEVRTHEEEASRQYAPWAGHFAAVKPFMDAMGIKLHAEHADPSNQENREHIAGFYDKKRYKDLLREAEIEAIRIYNRRAAAGEVPGLSSLSPTEKVVFGPGGRKTILPSQRLLALANALRSEYDEKQEPAWILRRPGGIPPWIGPDRLHSLPASRAGAAVEPTVAGPEGVEGPEAPGAEDVPEWVVPSEESSVGAPSAEQIEPEPEPEPELEPAGVGAGRWAPEEEPEEAVGMMGLMGGSPLEQEEERLREGRKRSKRKKGGGEMEGEERREGVAAWAGPAESAKDAGEAADPGDYPAHLQKPREFMHERMSGRLGGHFGPGDQPMRTDDPREGFRTAFSASDLADEHMKSVLGAVHQGYTPGMFAPEDHHVRWSANLNRLAGWIDSRRNAPEAQHRETVRDATHRQEELQRRVREGGMGKSTTDHEHHGVRHVQPPQAWTGAQSPPDPHGLDDATTETTTESKSLVALVCGAEYGVRKAAAPAFAAAHAAVMDAVRSGVGALRKAVRAPESGPAVAERPPAAMRPPGSLPMAGGATEAGSGPEEPGSDETERM